MESWLFLKLRETQCLFLNSHPQDLKLRAGINSGLNLGWGWGTPFSCRFQPAPTADEIGIAIVDANSVNHAITVEQVVVSNQLE
ncbi:hypothetical protein V6N11_047402 [Hibiscus sabdariffa]|uniref:Uncharacterized protein n=1 Tax=Hibiscus sabdariffa TaxID=183260 RepID=A0ABR1ZRW4_9ROSI